MAGGDDKGEGEDATEPVEPVELNLDDMLVSPTAARFEGFEYSPDVDTSVFVTRTPPGKFVEIHVHPYAETFFLLRGRGRWTSGDTVVEMEPDGVLIVPPNTPHGFRNIGDEPLLVVSTHERGRIEQTFLGREPA